MPPTLPIRVTASLLLLVVLGAGAAAATSVPIVNAGFDADPLSPGSFDTSNITGWNTAAGFGQGIYRPVPSDYPTGIPSSPNVAYSNGTGGRLWQVLTTQLEANTRYVLQVEIGWNNNDPFAGYIVQLRAGGATLAEDNSTQVPTQGSFVTSTVELVTGPNPDHLGSPLEIRLLSPGVQANFDDVRLTAEPVGEPCNETLVLPFYLSDEQNPSGTNSLYAVRNLTDEPVNAEVEYLTLDGTSQRLDALTLDAFETRTASLRDVAGLATDPDGFARGFLRITAAGSATGAPVLAGDFFLVDVANNFATGNQLLRSSEICRGASIRFLDFGAGARLGVYVTQPRGASEDDDPPSFTVQAYDEAGAPVGSPQPVWTADHALELAASDFTAERFGSLRFDFANSLGGTVYAEYSAQGRFSVGVASQCHGPRHCDDDCCPPGAPKAVIPGLHYPTNAEIPDCAAAIDDALRGLDSFHYRNACQQAHGGGFPDRVLGARVLECEVDPPGSEGNVVVAVEACCPLP